MTARERDRLRAARDAAVREHLATTAGRAQRRERLAAATVTDGKLNKSNHVRAVMRMLEDRTLP